MDHSHDHVHDEQPPVFPVALHFMLISDPAVTVITSSPFWLFTFIKIVWTVFGEFRPVAISVCVNTKGTEIGLFTRGTKKGNTNMICERKRTVLILYLLFQKSEQQISVPNPWLQFPSTHSFNNEQYPVFAVPVVLDLKVHIAVDGSYVIPPHDDVAV